MQNATNQNQSQAKSDKSDSSNTAKTAVAIVTPEDERRNEEQNRTRISKANFLEMFANSLGNITYSAAFAGISRETYYQWRKTDKEFYDRTEEILHQCNDVVEDVLKHMIMIERKEKSVHFYLAAKHPDYTKKVKTTLVDERTLEDLMDEDDEKQLGNNSGSIQDPEQAEGEGSVPAEPGPKPVLETEDQKKHNTESPAHGHQQDN